MAFAQAAMQECKLDEIIFLPERVPREKHGVTDVSHRTALIQIATKPLPSRILHLTSDQFTVSETLPELRVQLGNAQLTFLLGSDVVRTFCYRWDGLDTLFKEVAFAIGMRAGDDLAEIAAVMADMEQSYDVAVRHTYIQTPDSGFASSHIRSGTFDMALLDPKMVRYIREHGLYSVADN